MRRPETSGGALYLTEHFEGDFWGGKRDNLGSNFLDGCNTAGFDWQASHERRTKFGPVSTLYDRCVPSVRGDNLFILDSEGANGNSLFGVSPLSIPSSVNVTKYRSSKQTDCNGSRMFRIAYLKQWIEENHETSSIIT